MLRDKTRLAIMAVLLLALAGVIVFSLRGASSTVPAPTISVQKVQTEAVATFAAGLTSTATMLPTSTATGTTVPTVTSATTEAISPTPSCYRLKYLRDVTIPDNTVMSPAEVFTKAWQVQNDGICAWRVGFQLILVGGVAMGGSPFTLTQTVEPGVSLEVSVKMVAPTDQTGIVQGTWRMSDGNGTLFGDALTVVIVVGNGTSQPPTAAATGTP